MKFNIINKKGQIFKVLIDDEDWKKISQFKWFINIHSPKSPKYIRVKTKINKKAIFLHRFILNLNNQSSIVDHINGNGLDNRKSNLRICVRNENSKNRRKHILKSSKYKGVSWSKKSNKWWCRITVNRKVLTLGYFNDESEAAKVYNEASIKFHKEYGYLNDV